MRTDLALNLARFFNLHLVQQSQILLKLILFLWINVPFTFNFAYADLVSNNATNDQNQHAISSYANVLINKTAQSKPSVSKPPTKVANIPVAKAKINILASFSITQDIIKNVGGKLVDVHSIVQVGQDPHEYEIKPSDLAFMRNSSIIAINGLGFESKWLAPFLQQYSGVVVNLTAGIEPQYFKVGNKLSPDPHAWTNPQNVIKYYVPSILNALIKIDPKDKLYYLNNAKLYIKQLNHLDKYVFAQIKKVPKSQRCGVTTHDAFNYYAIHYGITLISVKGFSTDSEPSAHGIALIENTIRDHKGIPVFLEDMENNQLTEQIADDTHAILGGKLYSDSLSAPDGPASTYINLVNYNTNAFIQAWFKQKVSQ